MGNAIRRKDPGGNPQRVRNIRHLNDPPIKSVGYREHYTRVLTAGYTFTLDGSSLLMYTNQKYGEGVIVLVLDKQYVIDNNVLLQWGMRSSSVYSGFSRGAFDGWYDYTSLVDFPDYASILLKGSRIFCDTVQVGIVNTARHVYGLNLKTGYRYYDGVPTADDYEDWYGNSKTINDFTSDYVTAIFGMNPGGMGNFVTSTLTFDTVQLINQTTDEVLWTLDLTTMVSEVSGTIHDYGKFDFPASGWQRDRTKKHLNSWEFWFDLEIYPYQMTRYSVSDGYYYWIQTTQPIFHLGGADGFKWIGGYRQWRSVNGLDWGLIYSSPDGLIWLGADSGMIRANHNILEYDTETIWFSNTDWKRVNL